MTNKLHADCDKSLNAVICRLKSRRTTQDVPGQEPATLIPLAEGQDPNADRRGSGSGDGRRHLGQSHRAQGILMSDLKHYQLIAQPSMEPQTVIDLWSTPENIDALERTLRRLVFPYAFQLYVAPVPTEMTQIPKTRDYAGMFSPIRSPEQRTTSQVLDDIWAIWDEPTRQEPRADDGGTGPKCQPPH